MRKFEPDATVAYEVVRAVSMRGRRHNEMGFQVMEAVLGEVEGTAAKHRAEERADNERCGGVRLYRASATVARGRRGWPVRRRAPA